MNENQVIGSFTVVAFFSILVAIGSYIANIVTLINHINDPFTAMIVIRIVGIFVVPLGAVLGFF